MSGCLQLNSQKWNLWGSDGLKLFLPRQKLENSIYYQTDWSFVPPGVDAATVAADASRLRLRLIGHVPGLRDWRDLENLFLGYHDRIEDNQNEDDESSIPRGPDIWIWPPGETKPLQFGKWETDLKFGERHGREFDFSLEAICLSERASKFRVDSAVKEFFQQPLPPDWELPEWVDEVDDELSFEGRVEFREIFCSTPINGARPVEWARQLARRELAVEEFGPCTLSDVGHPDGKYNPKEGICETGRLVVLPMPVA
jgi:hypothetical protein